MMKSLHYTECSGTPHEIGLQLGAFGRAAVHSHLLQSSAWAELMQWQGHPSVAHMQKLVKEHFPAIWHELQGLAQGLELDFEQVFIWNARGDLWAHAPDGCSSVLQSTPHPRISHNEDGDPGFYGHCGLVKVQPQEGVEFISFIYPGSIPGHTFGINAHQLSFTVNNIRALFAQAGVPRMVLCRAALNCVDHEQVIELLRAHPRSGAFSLNIGDHYRHVHNVEFNDAIVSVQRIQRPYFHSNHSIHPAMRDFPQRITGTSGYRQLQGQALVEQPKFDRNPLAILGNDEHPRFPIYRRQADDTDNENTIATADFHYHADEVHWEVYDGPLQAPLYRFINLEKQ